MWLVESARLPIVVEGHLRLVGRLKRNRQSLLQMNGIEMFFKETKVEVRLLVSGASSTDSHWNPCLKHVWSSK